jgi:hypothetical protein
MKKLFIVLCVLLMAAGAWAADSARYSGSKAASASIATGEGYFYGVLIATDSTTGITVNVYDSTAASGSKLIPTIVANTSSIDRFKAIYPPVPVRYYNGIYVSISSTDCAYEVYYLPQ